jgi:chemotaxis protein histidine kinase CheA
LTAINPIAGGIALAIELGAKLLSIFSQNKTTGKDAGDAIKSSFDGANAAVTATLNNADKTFATLIKGFQELNKTLGDLGKSIEQINKDEQEWGAKTAEQELKSIEDQKKAALDFAETKNYSSQQIYNIAADYDQKLNTQYESSIEKQRKAALDKAKENQDSDKTIADINLYYDNMKLTYAANLANGEIALRDKVAAKESTDSEKNLTEEEKLAKSIYDSFVAADVKKNKLDAASAELQQKRGLTVQDAWLNVYANIQQAGESWNNTVQTISDSVSNTLSGGLKAMGAALIDGKASWKDYGKSALQALADVLDALGKQLSAMAAIAFGTGNFAGAAYDVPGAAAAFVSEGVITGLASKYATGTNYSVGGYALVGEYGPEIVKLPQGSQVNNSINNNQNSKQVTMYNSFNSPKALSEAEIGRQMRSMSRRMAFMGTI